MFALGQVAGETMKKSLNKRLLLTQENIRTLSHTGLSRVAGGTVEVTQLPTGDGGGDTVDPGPTADSGQVVCPDTGSASYKPTAGC